MRKLACLTLSMFAMGGLAASTASASITPAPNPCPVQPLVSYNGTNVTVYPTAVSPCTLQGTISPITVTT
jgi:hypothetical protein